MRRLILLSLLLLSCTAYAQNSLVKIDKQDVVSKASVSLYTYALDFENTVYLELSKAELWSNAKAWTSKNFKTKYVIDSEDKDLGRIILKYTFPIETLTSTTSATAHSTIQIDVRDGKFRIKLYGQAVEVKVKNMSYSGLPKSVLQTIKKDLEEVESISETYFNSKLTWDFNSQAGNELKIGTAYSMALYHVNNTNEEIVKSLIEALRFKDDF